jgi:hypothetical protein
VFSATEDERKLLGVNLLQLVSSVTGHLIHQLHQRLR